MIYKRQLEGLTTSLLTTYTHRSLSSSHVLFKLLIDPSNNIFITHIFNKDPLPDETKKTTTRISW